MVPLEAMKIPFDQVPVSRMYILNPLFRRSYGVDASRTKWDIKKGPALASSTSLHMPMTTQLSCPGQGAPGQKDFDISSWKGMLVSQPPSLVSYPRGWDLPRMGGTLGEFVAQIPYPKIGGMFVVVAGWPVDGTRFWEAVMREYRPQNLELELLAQGLPLRDEPKDQDEMEGPRENAMIDQEVAMVEEDVEMPDADEVRPGDQRGDSSEDENEGLWDNLSVYMDSTQSAQMPEKDAESEDENADLWDDSHWDAGEEHPTETADHILMEIEDENTDRSGEPPAPESQAKPEVIDLDTFEHSWWNEPDGKWDPSLAAVWRLSEKQTEDEAIWGKCLWDDEKGTFIDELEAMWGEMPSEDPEVYMRG